MDRLVCRTFPFESAAGAENMARDEALLDLITGAESPAALRLYGWSEPTLSLGYFQAIRDAEADGRWRSAPLVRRPTGGGALWHDREITYALALPRAHPLARDSATLYQAVHQAIARALAQAGVAAHRREEAGPVTAPTPRPFLCFADRDPNDLVIGPHKVVGSAQRRRAGAVLQHGSLLLARSPLTPDFPGLSDLADTPTGPAAWAPALAEALPEALGMHARPEPWPPALLAQAAYLRESVYQSPRWARRR